MDFALFAYRLHEAEPPDLRIYSDRDPRMQLIAVTETLADSRIEMLQRIDHFTNVRALHPGRFLSVRQIAEQGWNPNGCHDAFGLVRVYRAWLASHPARICRSGTKA